MEETKRCQIPAFGNWDFSHDLPITQYFESARQAGLLPKKAEDAEKDFRGDLKQPAPAFRRQLCARKQNQQEKEQKKQGRVCDATDPARQTRAPKAVDEDLYKIPPELVYKKPRNKLLGFLSRLFGRRRAYYYYS